MTGMEIARFKADSMRVKGMTNQQIADALGVSRTFVTRTIFGGRLPDMLDNKSWGGRTDRED